MLNNNTNKGFTLLEVMIAMVISAVSLLGLASLQSQSLSFNNSGFKRSQATYYAYEILEKMRTNTIEANSGNYDLAINVTPATASCFGTSYTCTATDLAAADISEWHSNVTGPRGLPGGITRIQRITSNGQTILEVLVRWDNLTSASTSEILLQAEL